MQASPLPLAAPLATPLARAAIASLTLLMATSFVAPGLGRADTVLPAIGPLPFERPYASASASAAA